MIDKICLIISIFHAVSCIVTNAIGYDKELFFIDHTTPSKFVTAIGTFAVAGKSYALVLPNNGDGHLAEIQYTNGYLTPILISYYSYCDIPARGISCFGTVVAVKDDNTTLVVGTKRESGGTGAIYLRFINTGTITSNNYLWDFTAITEYSSGQPISDMIFIEFITNTDMVLTPFSNNQGVAKWNSATRSFDSSWIDAIRYENCLCLSTTKCILHSISGANHLLYEVDPTSNSNPITQYDTILKESDTDSSIGDTFSFFSMKKLNAYSAILICTNMNCRVRQVSALTVDAPSFSINRGSAMNTNCDMTSNCYLLTTNDLSRLEIHKFSGSFPTLTREVYYSDTEYGFGRYSVIALVRGMDVVITTIQMQNKIVYVERKACHLSCSTCVCSHPSCCLSCSVSLVQETSPINLCVSTSACDASCYKCFDGTSSGCVQCNPGEKLNLTTNLCSPCNNIGQYYTNIGSGVDVCKSCTKNCVTCNSNTQYNCMSCDYTNNMYLNSGNECQSTPIGSYSAADSTLQTCDSNCDECIIISTNCTTCTLPLFLTPANMCCNVANCDICDTATPTTCIQCSSGYFLPSSATTCSICSSNCSTCITLSTHCTSCPPTYYLDTTTNTCVSCNYPGYYVQPPIPPSAVSTCDVCDANCLTCVTSAANCITCSSSMYLNSSSMTCVLCDDITHFRLDHSGSQSTCESCLSHPSPPSSCNDNMMVYIEKLEEKTTMGKHPRLALTMKYSSNSTSISNQATFREIASRLYSVIRFTMNSSHQIDTSISYSKQISYYSDYMLVELFIENVPHERYYTISISNDTAGQFYVSGVTYEVQSYSISYQMIMESILQRKRRQSHSEGN